MKSSNAGVAAIGAAAAVFAIVVGALVAVRSSAHPSTAPSLGSPAAPATTPTTAATGAPRTSPTPTPSATPSSTPASPSATSTPPLRPLDAAAVDFTRKSWGTPTISVDRPAGWAFKPSGQRYGEFTDGTGIRVLKVDATRTQTTGKTPEEDAVDRENELQVMAIKGTIKNLRILSREQGSIKAKDPRAGLDRAWASRDYTYTELSGTVREVHVRWIDLDAGQSASPTDVVVISGGLAVDYAALIKIMDRATSTVALAG
jgi:hypothetical protein